jgi:hypothetical protein
MEEERKEGRKIPVKIKGILRGTIRKLTVWKE